MARGYLHGLCLAVQCGGRVYRRVTEIYLEIPGRYIIQNLRVCTRTKKFVCSLNFSIASALIENLQKVPSTLLSEQI